MRRVGLRIDVSYLCDFAIAPNSAEAFGAQFFAMQQEMQREIETGCKYL